MFGFEAQGAQARPSRFNLVTIIDASYDETEHAVRRANPGCSRANFRPNTGREACRLCTFFHKLLRF